MKVRARRWVLLLGMLSTGTAPTYGAAGPGPADGVGEAAGIADVRAGEVTPAAGDAADEASAEPAKAREDVWEGNPRGQYNHALGRLAEGAFAEAAAGFLGARDAAGPDPELRYRAAFNLGLALAGEADAAAVAAPDAVEDRIETLRDSAAWFHDAVRLAPEGDDDARVNLEVVLRRIAQLADQLNAGHGLEARLDRVIDDQRGVRDRLRHLLAEVEAEGATAEPTGFQDAFEALAVQERTLLAEAADIADLAAEERTHIENQGDDAATPEQRARALQLASMDDYLGRARQSLNDTRRRLRRLEGERAHRRGDAALAELKRAREQLLDPVAVLKAVVRDELSLLGHTQALAAFSQVEIGVEAGLPRPAPPWLTGRHLTNRQEDAAARTGGVLRQMEALRDAPEDADTDPQTSRTLHSARAATPHVESALAAMRAALSALENSAFANAAGEEAQAVRSLNQAIERFAGLRDLIELAHADQGRAVALLTPPAQEDATVAELTTVERARLVSDAVGDNRNRLARIETLLQDALPGAAGEEADAAEAEAAAQRYERAEALRVDALRALETLAGELRAAAESRPATPLPPARDALGHLEALRRLFFSIVEHLQALLAEQTETHDDTATLQFQSQVDELVPELGLVEERQAGHTAMADALAGALANQADQANAASGAQTAGAGATGGADADMAAETADQAQAAAAAAGEVRAAAGRMQGARVVLADAAERAASMSPDLEPALTDQLAALEHVENAIRLLQPPQQNDEGGDDGSAQSGGQVAPAEPPQDAERMSQRQALRRLQAISDRDAQRQRERGQEAGQRVPVEKDW